MCIHRWPRKKSDWKSTTIKNLPEFLDEQYGFKLDQIPASDELVTAIQDLEEGKLLAFLASLAFPAF